MRETILTVLLIIILAAIGFVWFYYYRSPPAAALSAASLNDEKLMQFRQLKNVSPDFSVFSDPLFLALQPASSGAASTSIPQGRSNPFQPFAK